MMAPGSVVAQTQPAGAAAEQAQGLEDIIVTAEKREASINKVPMSITAVTGETLVRQGATEVRDLERIVTGFKYVEGAFAAPIYSIRGVGFNDSTIGSRPTVGLYVDEAPLPFSIVTRGAALDLERVEVLKGPQGTLFGQNATGGAINYIAAKPGSEFEAGVNASVGNFGYADLTGFVSGPVTDTLGIRVAGRGERGTGWQRSTTRPSDRLGDVDFLEGRILAAWKPNSDLTVQASLTGYRDRSETQAAQLLFYHPIGGPATLPPIAALAPTDPRAAAIIATSQEAAAPHDNKAADWTLGQDLSRDNRFLQGTIKIGYDITPDLTLTSLTSYIDYKHRQGQDPDGSASPTLGYVTTGQIKSFFQELRINAGLFDDRVKLVLGGNYAKDKTNQFDDIQTNSTVSFVFRPFVDYYNSYGQRQSQTFTTKAVFGNVDVSILDNVKAHAGIRYTDTKDAFAGCSISTRDNTIGRGLGAVFSALRAAFGLGGPVTINTGQCTVADLNFLPVDNVRSRLDEDNVSWRVGLDWEPMDRTLLYANVSKGYKAGNYPQVAATSTIQFIPARQESLLAYEAGFKTTLLGRTLQLNGAVFYYDYKDKQVRGRTAPLPPFGPLETLVNVPGSRIKGAEIAVTWMPVPELTFNGGATYLDSKISKDFIDYNPFGLQQNFRGQRLPLTPKWLWTAGVEYRAPVSDRLNAFAGTTVSYQGQSNAAFGELDLFNVQSYALVDVRAGVETADKSWTVTLWGKNIFDKYHYTNVFFGVDQVVRFTGRPASYGITLGYRM